MLNRTIRSTLSATSLRVLENEFWLRDTWFPRQRCPDVLLLQALPRNEQTPCEYFSAFAVAVSVLLASDQRQVNREAILDSREKHFCTIRDTIHI
jgi:hypothetical protein